MNISGHLTHQERVYPGPLCAQGFDISFLVTHTHLEKLWKHKLIDFIIQFMEDIDKEISGMKIAINARGRIIAQQFMLQFVQ